MRRHRATEYTFSFKGAFNPDQNSAFLLQVLLKVLVMQWVLCSGQTCSSKLAASKQSGVAEQDLLHGQLRSLQPQRFGNSRCTNSKSCAADLRVRHRHYGNIRDIGRMRADQLPQPPGHSSWKVDSDAQGARRGRAQSIAQIVSFRCSSKLPNE